jgi:hypothetical protein
MSEHGWPPPAADSDEYVWRTIGLPAQHQERVKLRRTKLWGRPVDVDAAGRVWCPCCWSLVDVETLGTPGNRHAASPFAGTYGVRILPIPESEDEPAASQSIDVRKF